MESERSLRQAIRDILEYPIQSIAETNAKAGLLVNKLRDGSVGQPLLTRLIDFVEENVHAEVFDDVDGKDFAEFLGRLRAGKQASFSLTNYKIRLLPVSNGSSLEPSSPDIVLDDSAESDISFPEPDDEYASAKSSFGSDDEVDLRASMERTSIDGSIAPGTLILDIAKAKSISPSPVNDMLPNDGPIYSCLFHIHHALMMFNRRSLNIGFSAVRFCLPKITTSSIHLPILEERE
jgi:hypothetical protein